MPLRRNLTILSVFLIVPFLVITSFLLYNFDRFCTSYDTAVANVTNANRYNLTFKENIDAVLYQMVARSVNKNELRQELGMPDPDDLINDAEGTFMSLKEASASSAARDTTESILKLMVTLRKRVNDIDSSLHNQGSYDENMMRLDTDIRILTELIQKRINEYIYYEAANMENIRIKMLMQRDILVRFTLITVFVMLAVSIFFSAYITRSITKPVEELCRITERVGTGDFSTWENREEENEIAVLNNSINSMVGQLGQLVDNIRTEQINSRNLELRLLQAQINPHFLYNTLDNIVWLAEDGRTEDVENLVTYLSQFFRAMLSGGREFISIKQEISHVEAYLSIQSFRYRDILSYEINVPEEFSDYYIIKMTLQPVVENALYHGIKYKRQPGRIRIGIREEGENLIFIIEDDGIGMKEEELLRVRRLINGMESPGEDNSGFGLVNVAERMRLRYGVNYGMNFESEYGRGTRVEIQIPKLNENEVPVEFKSV